jgi:ferrous iron transport protein B
MHPLWGIPVLLLVLWGMYQFVGVLGAGTLVDLLETRIFQNHLSPWAMRGVDALLQFPHQHTVEQGVRLPEYVLTGDLGTAERVGRFVHDLLVGPYGQITMALSYAIALILPIVATFFLAFGLLEDSGYLPRLAVMVNRLFRLMGLNGKAVLPMVLGLGCDTMATLTTRILETRKERIIVTLLLALGVPCSAQLGVILGMIRSLSLGATLVWAGSILVTMFAVGWLAARILPGRSGDFILELPPIRRPQLGNLVVKTLARIEWYLREAVPLFLLGTFVLFVADLTRLLDVIERIASPIVVGLLGLPSRAAEAFLIGFLRRDYGAAGLYDMARDGQLAPVQLVVSMVTITLFIPCIANFFIMIKERGAKTALAMTAFIVPMALLVGGALNFGLRWLGVTF